MADACARAVSRRARAIPIPMRVCTTYTRHVVCGVIEIVIRQITNVSCSFTKHVCSQNTSHTHHGRYGPLPHTVIQRDYLAHTPAQTHRSPYSTGAREGTGTSFRSFLHSIRSSHTLTHVSKLWPYSTSIVALHRLSMSAPPHELRIFAPFPCTHMHAHCLVPACSHDHGKGAQAAPWGVVRQLAGGRRGPATCLAAHSL